MPTLHEVQASMAKTLLQGEVSAENLIVEGPERLDIYRNTIEGVLTGALRLTFPAVDRLVGAAFFDALALAFARRHPPSAGCLDDWGGELAHFLEEFPPAATVPYLADVARLEWAVFRAARAADVPSLDPAKAGWPLSPHPSFSLVAVTWPAEAIRRAVLEDDFNGLALDRRPRWLAVHRLAGDVVVRSLDAEAAAFTRSLIDGETFVAEPSPAHLALLAEHLAAGCFQESADDHAGEASDRPA
jgi:hypothetical protein